MLDKIYVFDDIIEKDYQNKIKNVLIGQVRYNDEDFPWYYIDDVTASGDYENQKEVLLFMIMYIMNMVLRVTSIICF